MSLENQLAWRHLQNGTKDSTSNECISSEYGRIADGLVTFSLLYAILNLLLMFSGITLWYMHKDRLYLKRRNFDLVLLMCLGWLCNTICGPLYRSTLNDKDSIFQSCFVVNVTFFLALPFVAIPQVVRIILFNNRIDFNRKISELFRVSNELKDEENDAKSTAKSVYSHEKISINSTLKSMKFRASRKFGLLVSIGLMLMMLVVGIVFGLLSCRTSLTPDVEECTYLSFTNGLNALFLSVPLMISAILHFYFQIKTNGEPDPFKILREIRFAYLPVMVIGVPGLILANLDPGKIQVQNPFQWKWTIFIDIAYTIFFIYTLHYQVYASHRKISKSELSMESVLANKTGATLFEQHLVNEFSVDNLLFMRAIEKWKNQYGRVKDTVSTQEAQRIYERWIKHGAFFQANVSSDSIENVSIIFETNSAEMVPADLFDSSYSEVYNLLDRDSFVRFRMSNLFKQYIGQEEVTLESVHTFLDDE